jgi:hypothetical protein
MDHVRYVWSRVIRELSVESVWCVGRVFPCRMYIDSNCLDIGYEYRLFVAVIT